MTLSVTKAIQDIFLIYESSAQGRRKQHEAAGAGIYGGDFIILSLVKIV